MVLIVYMYVPYVHTLVLYTYCTYICVDYVIVLMVGDSSYVHSLTIL